MGLTKQYLRYAHEATFGIIASSKGGAVSLDKNLVAAGTAETVTIWNMKTGEKANELMGPKAEVTALAADLACDRLAAGYNDGSVRLFTRQEDGRFDSEECVALNGHKSAVTCLAFDLEGHRLASGGKDTNVIVWDVVNECGLFRLKGHRGPVTSLAFHPERSSVLASSSKDTLVKFWDLDVQHCFKTLAGHVTEVWDFVFAKDYVVTGSGDSELRVFRLTFRDHVGHDGMETVVPQLKKLKVEEGDSGNEADDDDDPFDGGHLKIERVGSILRQAQDKVAHLVCDAGQRLFAVHGSAGNTVETFLICTDEEAKKRLGKRAKKERKKKQLADLEVGLTIQDEFKRLTTVKAGGKVKHVGLTFTGEATAQLLVATANNLVETHSVQLESADVVRCRSLGFGGHRSDVRTVAFSSCGTALASVSHESLKVWNRSGGTCVRTVDSGYGLCCMFAPGDRQVVVGTKAGHVQIFDLDTAAMTGDLADAHAKEVWALCAFPDRKGFVTASADQTVKFWSYEPVPDRGWTAVHSRTLQLDEDALAVRMSPNGKLVAVSLLDSTVKVFFADTLKFFLSLYGHKLPALAVDVSSDSALIVTAGADKNAKIWGLDFGDCHKSIFAHDDGITAVQFVPGTHHFFTCGKDGKVKRFDADNFERIQTLDGHHGEIWAMSVSPNGKFVVTAGHDKTLRLWEKTQEPLVLEDERETEREREEEEQLATADDRDDKHNKDEAGLATRKTAETERSAERLMEAVEAYKRYREECRVARDECAAAGRPFARPALPLVMAAYGAATAEDFMASALARIRSSEVEEALAVLPLDFVVALVEIIRALLAQDVGGEAVARAFLFLVELHFGPLSAASSPTVRSLLESTRDLVDRRLGRLKSTVGFNVAALRFVRDAQDDDERGRALVEAATRFKDKRRKRRQQQRALQTAIIAL